MPRERRSCFLLFFLLFSLSLLTSCIMSDDGGKLPFEPLSLDPQTANSSFYPFAASTDFDYEAQRLANIKANAELLASLGIAPNPSTVTASSSTSALTPVDRSKKNQGKRKLLKPTASDRVVRRKDAVSVSHVF
jgi:hypothetical protein